MYHKAILKQKRVSKGDLAFTEGLCPSCTLSNISILVPVIDVSQSALHREAGKDQDQHIDAAPYDRDPGRHAKVTGFVDRT